MTAILALDPSALVQRYTGGPHSAAVNAAMAATPTWAISELARAELLMALHRISPDGRTAAELTAAARADVDAMFVVPLDERALGRSIELGTLYGLRTVDAMHLAALDRLPRPLGLATLDARQIPAAVALDIEVVTPLERP
ncbi:MAG: type II toxin-antitoxin system VapC family toxin [Actinomycetota bacterium]